MRNSNSIASRTRELIDLVHDGSVNAAARDTGISQRTLARIADGTVENPRADALQKLAAFYQVSLEWLVTGEGQGPDETLRGTPKRGEDLGGLRDELRWEALRTRLNLSVNAGGALNVLRSTVGNASMHLHASATGKPLSMRKPVIPPLRFIAYMTRENRLWLDYFDEAIEVYGEEKVRRWLEENWKMIASRFTTPMAWDLGDRSQ